VRLKLDRNREVFLPSW